MDERALEMREEPKLTPKKDTKAKARKSPKPKAPLPSKARGIGEPRISDELIMEAALKHYGNMSAMARAMKVSRQYLYRYVNLEDKAHLLEAIAESREVALDDVESVLLRDAKKGGNRIAATIFYLKTQGKGRGYSERVEITGKEGSVIKVGVDLGRI